MMECGLTVWDLLKGAFNLIKVPVGYAMSSNSFANDLRDEVQNLEDQVEKVEVLADQARNNVRRILGVFTTWKQRAVEALEEARKLLGDFEASKTCCHGTLPNPYCRYRFSTEAEGKIEVIKKLAREGSEFKVLDDISCIGPAPGNDAAPTPARREGKDVVQSTTATASVFSASMSIKLRDNGVFESRALMIRKIMDALANNSNRVIGVYGMGGVGKSTLLEEVQRILNEEKSFDWVAKADVSETPDIQTIQREIAKGLKLTDIENEKTISGRAELLHGRLKKEEREKKKVLVILDNLWEGLDLKKVGIPCDRANTVEGCKLLLTSRHRDVLRRNMGCDKDFPLGGLQVDEARRLFEGTVGDKVYDDEFKPWVEVAVNKCAGVPFLIVAMAKRFKDADLPEWKDTLKKMEKFKDKESNDLIDQMLQWSYEKLEGEVKSLLRLCVVYGVSKPSLENLVRYGVGLGLFQEVSSMEEAADRVRTHIRTLQASSLLLDSEDVDSFKIHDLVREFVASVSSRDHHPLLVLKDKVKSVIELPKDKLESCEAICFPYIDMEELPQELVCPELGIFLLFTDNESLHVPYSLFNSMRKLMVLSLTGICLTRSLTPIQSLENLHTLCLQRCSVEDVAILGKLKGLQILSIVDSKIQRLPKEIGQLVELRSLDLSRCSQLQIIESGVLGSLTKLEELYMEDSFDQWDAVEQTQPTNASLLELNNMKNLCTLHVSIPNPSVLPKDLNFKQLTKYRILLGYAECWSKYKGSRTMHLKLNPTSDILQKECIQSILCKTDDLFLDELNGIEQSIFQLSREGFPQLKHLRVKSCNKMEVLFPRSLVSELPRLEEIEVDSCELMQGIVGADDRGKVELPKLRVLKMRDLPNVKNFSTARSAPSSNTSDDQVGTQIALFNGQQVSIPSLESLTMKRLPNLQEIWSDESPLEPSNLQSLKVVRCESLSKIISSRSLLKLKLHKLHTLTIKDCVSVQEIFDLDGPSAGGDIQTLSQLTTLELNELPSLRRICNKNPCGIVSFQSLKKLEVDNCDNLGFIFFPSMVKSLAQLRDLTVSQCKKVEAIITEEEEGLGMEMSETLAFPMLTDLRLRWLESLTCFSREKCSREARSQDRIQSRSTALFNREVAFPRLETLDVSGLNNLRFIFSSSMVKSLTQLKNLSIWYCEKMEAIIMEEEDGLGMETSETLAFPMLIDLRLYGLESLTCFSRGKCSREARSEDRVQSHSTALFNREVAFPRLETLEIAHFDNLRFMFFPSMVKSLTQLKRLSVWYCEKMEAIIMEEEEGLGMETSEILAFPMLTHLELEYLESFSCFFCGKCSREARSQDCVKSRSTVLFNREVVFPSLEELEISGMVNIERILENQLAVDCFQCLRSVSVSKCESLTSLFSASVARDLIHLEELKINECGIVELIEKEGLVPRDVFPKLTSLKLKHLTELKCIYTETHALHWPALKTMKVYDCNKVEILASQPENKMLLDKQPLFLIEKGAFPNLQELKLDICEWMETWHGHFHDEEFFCKLRVLELRHLSKEYAVSTCRFVESLTNLEELVVCESYLEEPTSNVEAIESPSQELKVILPFSRCIQHLKTLNVSCCDGLSSMFTPTIAGNLVALTKLRISNCRMLTEVISDEGSKEGHVVAFNHLKCMELDGLIRLRCFSSGGYTLKFPLLEDVIVNGCPNMKFFSEGPIEAPKLERVQVALKKLFGPTEYKHFWKGNLNLTIQNMFEEMAVVAGDKFMRLFEFPDLIGKWHSKLNPIKSSWRLESLIVDKCPSFINAIPSKLMLVLDNMIKLYIRDCDSLEEIFDLERLEAMESTRVLPRLEDLDLVNLPKLGQLWNKDLQGTMRFDSLSCLALCNCSNLRHAFTPSMARCLANLRSMKIKKCDQMEGVIVDEEAGQGSAVEKITFPKLCVVKLECLPNLTSFLSGKNRMLNCPKMGYMTIADCPKMRSLTWQSSVDIDHGTPSLFTPQVQFPQLKSMILSHMDNLSKIWTDGRRQETLTFDSLRQVEVKNCTSLENLFPHWVATSLNQLEKLRVESCEIEEIVTCGDDPPRSNTAQALFPKLTSLVLHIMPRLKSFCPNLPTLNWQFLKELQVTHCDKVNMLSFAASMNKLTQRDDQQDLSDQEARSSFERDFPNLKRLLLVNKDIQMIQDGKFPDDIFDKPKGLTLACFHDEKAIFPPRSLLERFQNVESLEVFCSSFEDIFPDEGLVDEGKHSVLENLRELKLSKLHNLKCVWREDYLVAKILQSIETFEVWDCPCLTIIFPTVTSFQNLTRLVVKNSSGLVHLVTASTITNLVHLTNMTIMGCERMKEVVANDGNGEGKVISLGKLTWLTLCNLPSLECFSSITSCSFRFPSLLWIEVEECPKMKIFSKGTLSTPHLNIVRMFRYKWEWNWEGDLNTTIQKLSA